LTIDVGGSAGANRLTQPARSENEVTDAIA
jgi:hypothetical protein